MYGHLPFELTSVSPFPGLQPSAKFALTSLEFSLPQNAPVTSLECALMQVFILKNFKSAGMNTYEKHGGGGVLLLTRPSDSANSMAIYGRRWVPSMPTAEDRSAAPKRAPRLTLLASADTINSSPTGLERTGSSRGGIP